MSKYAAFLRGINVGGKKSVKMEELKKVFETMGFKNVKTLLASGNVIFETKKSSVNSLSQNIKEILKKTFGFEINVIIRSVEELQLLFDSNPFKKISVTPQTRLYVTFLSEKSKSKLKIPYESTDKNFKILTATQSEVCSVLIVTPDTGTIDAMDILEKEFGKKVTTRNWNTVVKILNK